MLVGIKVGRKFLIYLKTSSFYNYYVISETLKNFQENFNFHIKTSKLSEKLWIFFFFYNKCVQFEDQFFS